MMGSGTTLRWLNCNDDLDRMSQDSDRTGIRLERPEILCKPGDGIQFGAVSLDEARLALQEMEDRINDFKPKFN